MVEDNERREKEKAVDQKKNGRRQSMQQKRGKRVNGEGLPGGKAVGVEDRREAGGGVVCR